MQKATVVDLQEFRRRREAQRRQPSQMMPIVMWYPIQWVWTWPVMPTSTASAMA
ncbi:MAG: hypothetical protein U1F76_06655 [Candidatus Competibacteraceae bacterium]